MPAARATARRWGSGACFSSRVMSLPIHTTGWTAAGSSLVTASRVTARRTIVTSSPLTTPTGYPFSFYIKAGSGERRAAGAPSVRKTASSSMIASVVSTTAP